MTLPPPLAARRPFLPHAWSSVPPGVSLLHLTLDYLYATRVTAGEAARFVLGYASAASYITWNLVEPSDYLIAHLQKCKLDQAQVTAAFPAHYLRQNERKHMVVQHLRYCVQCAKFGIHLAIQQCETVSQCPIHSMPIVETDISLTAVGASQWAKINTIFEASVSPSARPATRSTRRSTRAGSTTARASAPTPKLRISSA